MQSNSSNLKISFSKIHKISINTRKKLDQGSCTIYEEDNSHFFRVNHYVRNLKNMVFGQVKYLQSTSYFWYQEAQDGFIYVLSLSHQNTNLENLKQFHHLLSKYAVVHDLIEMQPSCELYKNVKQAYPQFQTKEVMNTSNAFTNISKKVGGLAGALSQLFTKPVQKVAGTIQQKKQQIYESKVGQGTKSKWQTVKQKAQQLNIKMAQGFRPVTELSKNISSKIGHSFNHSQNGIIKAVRDISKKTKDSLNEGYKQALKQPQNHKPLAAQSDSVLQVNVKK